ncbi:MAG: protein-tyrosine-phosphatase [Butyrivibrio sp.]|nr:protein-tyrosine-phosphatase [Butyrivibrio sp.]
MKPSIDIHCHIMPGVDDGSPDMETSLEMLKIAERDGIGYMILTPHYKPMHHNVSPQHNILYRQELQKAAKEAGLKIKLFSGNEIYYGDDTIERLAAGEITSLAGSDYVLVEFHPTNTYKSIQNAVYQVMSTGYIPVIAHVERYSDIVSHPSYVEDLVNMGCYIQVNASSVLGDFGFGISHFTKKLLKNELVHFVATDAHDTKRRSPKLTECRKYVERKFGEDYADRLFMTNPAKLIRNESI